MISDLQLSTLLLVASVIWGTLLILDGVSVSFQFFKPLSAVVGVLVLFLSAFDQWAWRLSIFHPWLVSTPDLQGTWKGQIVSAWSNPETKEGRPPLEAYLVIRQSFSAIHVRLLTEESSSESLAGSIVKNADGTLTIAGTYRNTPKLLIRERSPIHHGGLLLSIQGNPPNALEGQYWTDRDTKGEIRFAARSKKLYWNFESAKLGSYVKGR